MTADVKLVGLDFGTTTSSAVIASAQLTRNIVTGRSELTGIRETYRSEMVFTPFRDGQLDESALSRHVDDWLAAGNVDPQDVFGGGALLTGLAAQQKNAAAVTSAVRNRLENALIATADDPRLESWLAFMGSCAELSRTHPEVPILNLDIGGGTTNLALGQGGNVLRTGCLYVGARHIQVAPGSYEITGLSPYAVTLLSELQIEKSTGDCLTEADVESILAFYKSLLTEAIERSARRADSAVARLHKVSPLRLPVSVGDFAVTVSGGVGELIYSHLHGEPWPSTTCFGDLGIDLAKAIVDSSWAARLLRFAPQSAGRATAFGLLRHNTEVSGSTLFLPNSDVLPLTDLPILGVIKINSTDEDIAALVSLAKSAKHGSCVRIQLPDAAGPALRRLAERISQQLQESEFPPAQPLLLLVSENVGKVLGHYVTRWGTLPLNLVVIDEIDDRHAQYVRVGRLHEQVVPVSFYGLQDQEDS